MQSQTEHARMPRAVEGWQPSLAKMAVSWTRNEVLKLIEIWGDGDIQAQLEGCKRNQDVYDLIAAELCEAALSVLISNVETRSRSLKVNTGKLRTKE